MKNRSKRPNKIRLNLGISADAAQKGRVLAKAEKRSFSNLLEVLIDRACDAKAPACDCEKAAAA
jgi:hypothetical protein